MTVFEAIYLMLSFGTFIVALLSFIIILIIKKVTKKLPIIALQS